jgi:hypothetical protein
MSLLDLAHLEAMMDARFREVDGRFVAVERRLDALERGVDNVSREIRAQTWKLMTLMVAVVGVVVAAVRL